jgi:hypothetical protein
MGFRSWRAARHNMTGTPSPTGKSLRLASVTVTLQGVLANGKACFKLASRLQWRHLRARAKGLQLRLTTVARLTGPADQAGPDVSGRLTWPVPELDGRVTGIRNRVDGCLWVRTGETDLTRRVKSAAPPKDVPDGLY